MEFAELSRFFTFGIFIFRTWRRFFRPERHFLKTPCKSENKQVRPTLSDGKWLLKLIERNYSNFEVENFQLSISKNSLSENSKIDAH